jgi:hypothetical protein
MERHKYKILNNTAILTPDDNQIGRNILCDVIWRKLKGKALKSCIEERTALETVEPVIFTNQ